MKILCLLLVLGCAACAKKPAAKAPAPPPATDEATQAPDAQPTETTAPRKAAGDPCAGGEKQ